MPELVLEVIFLKADLFAYAFVYLTDREEEGREGEREIGLQALV